MAFENLQLYKTSVTAANRIDIPYYANTVGTVINGGTTGTLDWANNNRVLYPLNDNGTAYYELEVTSATNVRVHHTTELGEQTYTDNTVTAGSTYTTLVPSVTIELYTSLSVGHKAKVYPCLFPGAMITPRGNATTEVKLFVRNPGDVDHIQASLQLGRMPYYQNTTNTPLANITAIYLNPTIDSYDVVLSAGTLTGLKVTSTGTHNTYTADNVSAGATGIPLDDSASTGITFDLDASAAEGDTAKLVVSGDADGLELAPDNGGVAGTWVTWSSGVTLPLNRAGYTDRRIPAGTSIACWIRYNGDSSHTIGRGFARILTISYKAEE